MDFTLLRTLRTPHSERFILRKGERDAAAVDIHYRANGSADATLILVENGGFAEKDVPDLLTKLDEVLLPDVSLGERSLSFTVVVGRVLGAFTPEPDGTP